MSSLTAKVAISHDLRKQLIKGYVGGFRDTADGLIARNVGGALEKAALHRRPQISNMQPSVG